MNIARGSLLTLLIALPFSPGCSPGERPLFNLLPPDRTGVTFANTITTNDSVNVQTDVFVYNGAGVAVGDIDHDGLPDLFFTGNMVSSRLYLNKGDFRFEDITHAAGVATDRWATGASMVDINGDGYLDIYVSVSGPEWSTPERRANLLFMNNGDRTFTEAAAAHRIADTGFTTHAVFFDYDLDGDLDLFLLMNSPAEFERGEAERHPAGIRSQSSGSYDQLYRNNGDGTFTNVSREAGILTEVGYGLGVVVADLNKDGWPDIYVSNDGAPSDVLYVNNGNGTFTDKAAAWLKHTSMAGMGMDIADFNNDGWPDILQTDMMPHDLRARKRMSGSETFGSFMQLRRRGFHPDYTLNSLQLSNGRTPAGDIVFSEIARLAGVAYTEWSWSALFGDYDNDGYKDIFITNGYPKAVIDYDYQTAMRVFRRIADTAESRRRAREALEALHSYRVPNYVFRNEGDLTFTDRTGAWGMNHAGFSSGAAHADLNNDGRLDLVVNNIDAPAFIYQSVRRDPVTRHYLQVVLRGAAPNTQGIGSKLMVTARGQRQYIDHTPYRGFMSSMDDRIHFGLGAAARVDTLEVVWPDGRRQVLTDVAVDRMVTVKQEDATTSTTSPDLPRPRLFQPMRGLSYTHDHRGRVDYGMQPLLPYMVSRQGPPLTVGDVTGDGLDDVFVGGPAGFPGRLFIQRADGRFVAPAFGQPWEADREHEDWGALFFDANGDGRLDLYVASGGYHLAPASALLQDRLYINRGGGRFAKDTVALPEMLTSTASVVAGDYTGDGRLDLFVGGRLVPGNYPFPTRSYVLRNDGDKFTDITRQSAPELVEPGGLITDAAWIDFDGDGRLDLVTVGEWMPIRFYANHGERFLDVTASRGLPPMRGWWYSLETGDFNGDGRPDLVAGNLGLNHTYTTSAGSRFGVYAADFTGNLTTDIVLTQQIDGTEYPVGSLAHLGRAIYTVGVKFSTHESFSRASVQQVFSVRQLNAALHYQADTFASVYLQNNGDGTFTSRALPNLAQLSPIRGMIAHDVDGDGHLDLIVAGNIYHTEPNTPRADAGNGLWLRGDGTGHFTPVPPVESGFLAPRDATALALTRTPKGIAVVVANNGDFLQAFMIRAR
ncbi:MAG: VCBS repeat-containing protein [Gemmatimonadales bacterium]